MEKCFKMVILAVFSKIWLKTPSHKSGVKGECHDLIGNIPNSDGGLTVLFSF